MLMRFELTLPLITQLNASVNFTFCINMSDVYKLWLEFGGSHTVVSCKIGMSIKNSIRGGKVYTYTERGHVEQWA